MKKGDVIRQKCVNTTFYLTGILAHKVNNICVCTCEMSMWYTVRCSMQVECTPDRR